MKYPSMEDLATTDERLINIIKDAHDVDEETMKMMDKIKKKRENKLQYELKQRKKQLEKQRKVEEKEKAQVQKMVAKELKKDNIEVKDVPKLQPIATVRTDAEKDDLFPAKDFHGIVVVTNSFNAPVLEIPVENKNAGLYVHAALSDAKFSKFQRGTTKLLINPSIVEYLDAMDTVKNTCNEDSVFFLCIASHGIRIEGGEYGGSYIMFQETRISTEPELNITAISDKQLAEQLHGIPCKNKFVALDICQQPDAIKKRMSHHIHGKVHAKYLQTIHSKLVQLTLADLKSANAKSKKHAISDKKIGVVTNPKTAHTDQQVLEDDKDSKTKPAENIEMQQLDTLKNQAKIGEDSKKDAEVQDKMLTDQDELASDEVIERYTTQIINGHAKYLHTVLLGSCDPKHEQSYFNGDGESVYLRRIGDAIRGGGASQGKLDKFKNWTEDDDLLPFIYCKNICDYVIQGTRVDAITEPTSKGKTDKLRAKKASASSKLARLQTPVLVGSLSEFDFPVGHAPRVAARPFPPIFIASTKSSITIKWSPPPNHSGGTILGYQVQRKGGGRACSEWTSTGPKMVELYDAVVRHSSKVTVQYTSRGLTTDLSYCFRVRCRNAGGWSEYSDASDSFRTSSHAPSYSVTSDVERIFSTQGMPGIVAMLQRSPSVAIVQRLGIQRLAKLLITYNFDYSSCKEAIDCGTLQPVVKAMTTFEYDMELQLQGAIFIRRIARNDQVRKDLNRKKTGVKPALRKILKIYPRDQAYVVCEAASLALDELAKKPTKRKMGINEAAMKIQQAHRNRRIRYLLQTLTDRLFEQQIDPQSGAVYYINIKTGESMWEAPNP